MHGDYCFSNIIFNHKDGIVKLIDPTGSFGSKIGIYGEYSRLPKKRLEMAVDRCHNLQRI